MGQRQDNCVDYVIRMGAVYVFRRSGNKWSEEAYLKPSARPKWGGFGNNVSLYGDTLAVGTPGNGLEESIPDSGAVYLFSRIGDA